MGAGRKRDVDLDAIYGAGTVELQARMRALVLLGWRREGPGFAITRLTPGAALQRFDFFRKDLGVFDLDRTPGAPVTAAERQGYEALVERVPVFEISGRVDFRALVGAVATLLAA